MSAVCKPIQEYTFCYMYLHRGTGCRSTTNTEVVCITDEDKDIIEYIAEFAVHLIRQKAYRLKCGIEKSTTWSWFVA